ncbi:MAG: hypothetical protein ACYC92_14240 [Candidatus Acidiferrales bacterium]
MATTPVSKPQNPRHRTQRTAAAAPSHSPDAAARLKQQARAAALGRHRRRCAICHHPELEEIEAEFIRWADPHDLVDDYQLPSRSAIYRHAEATGLLARRRRNLRGVSERILECVTNASPSASSVLRAMRIFAHITEDGQWIEPPKRAIVTHVHAVADPDVADPEAGWVPKAGSPQRAEAPASASAEAFHNECREEAHEEIRGEVPEEVHADAEAEYIPRAPRASRRTYRPAPISPQSELDAFAARVSSRGKPASAAGARSAAPSAKPPSPPPAAPSASPAGDSAAIPPRSVNASGFRVPPEMEGVLRQTVATATARLENRAAGSKPSTTSPLPDSPNKSAPEFLIGTPNALNGRAND